MPNPEQKTETKPPAPPRAASLKELSKGEGKKSFLVLPQDILVGHMGRSADTDVESLAIDMAENGQMQPVGVREEEAGVTLVWGSRRRNGGIFINDNLADPEEPFYLECVLAEGASSEAEYFERTLRENHERQGTTAIDDAHNIDELMGKYKRKVEDVAKLYGMSSAWVSHRRKLLKLAPELQQATHEGKLPAAAAYELTQAKPEVQAKIAAKVAKGEAVTVEQAIKAAKSSPPKAKKTPTSGGQTKATRVKTLKQVKQFFAATAAFDDASRDSEGWLADLGASLVKWAEGKLSDGGMTRKLLEWGSIEPAPVAKAVKVTRAGDAKGADAKAGKAA